MVGLGNEESVKIDLNVILKIVQNLSDVPQSEISYSAGALIGVPMDNCVNITNSFAFPRSNYNDYNLEMSLSVEKSGLESLVIGLYTATLIDSFVSEDFLNKLYLYQSTIKSCIVLVFDYFRISEGINCISAYRLSNEGLEIMGNKEVNKDNRSLFMIQNLLVELPLYVHVSKLSYILLEKLKPEIKYNFDFMGFDKEIVLDKKYYLLIKSIDELSQECHNIQTNLRKVSRQYSNLDSIKQGKDNDKSGENAIDDEEPGSISINNRISYFINKWSCEYLNNQIDSIGDNLLDVTQTLDIMTETLNKITI